MQNIYQSITITKTERQIISGEIQKLLQNTVIYPCMRAGSDFMSSIFTLEKKNGSFRMIQNLKQLNKHNEYELLKMESF